MSLVIIKGSKDKYNDKMDNLSIKEVIKYISKLQSID